ncbi:MAG: DUF2256 and DUF3253 domain-containing protein [Phycisphaeraceae bacterium]|nr:DUF2256 and DUF3253 domain-containing protein [Phycisphaeraceae bacterium]
MTMSPRGQQFKICETCGRSFSWRKKWERNWDEVRYCSDLCRREKPGPLDARLEADILDLLQARGPGATLCPSEAARNLQPEHNKSLQERTRRAVRRLARQGKVEITQDGVAIDPDAMRGSIRIRLRA